MNAEALSVSEDRVLIAGYPNYIWNSKGGRKRDEPVADRIFGLVLDPDGDVSAVPPPRSGTLGGVHAIRRPEGGWHVIFAEQAESIRETIVPEILGLWAGVFDGKHWSAIERLPLPEQYELDLKYPEGASLIRSGDTLALAVIADPAGQVLLFERVDGRWSWERVTIPSTKRYPDPVTVEHLALVPWPTGFALVLHKPDVTIDTIRESLFLYTRDPGWQERKLVDLLPPYVGGQFRVDHSTTPDVVSSVSEGRVVAYIGSFETGRMRAIAIDSAGAATSGTALHSMTSRFTRLPDGTPLWVAQPLTPDESGELRFLVATRDSIRLIETITHPHWRLQAITASPQDIVIATVGLRFEAPTVSSLILRVRAQCHGFRHGIADPTALPSSSRPRIPIREHPA